MKKININRKKQDEKMVIDKDLTLMYFKYCIFYGGKMNRIFGLKHSIRQDLSHQC